METTDITDELIMITFPPTEGQFNCYNAYLFHRRGRGFLLDTCGFPHSEEISEYVKRTNIIIEGVIFSHYHSDHIGGYSKVEDLNVLIGSDRYDEMLSCYQVLENREKYIPTHSVTDAGLSVEIAGFKIECLKTPGHSPCSITTIIDDEYLHIGDIIINANDKSPILPLFYYELFQDQLNSIDKIQNYTSYHWLLGHGVINQDVAAKIKILENQKKYIQAVANSKGDISVENALQIVDLDYKHRFWHERNLPDENE